MATRRHVEKEIADSVNLGTESERSVPKIQSRRRSTHNRVRHNVTSDELAELYSRVLERAKIGLELSSPPKTWKDIKIADDILRRAAGLDEKSVKIAGLFQNSEMAGIGIEIGNKFLDTDENCAE